MITSAVSSPHHRHAMLPHDVRLWADALMRGMGRLRPETVPRPAATWPPSAATSRQPGPPPPLPLILPPRARSPPLRPTRPRPQHCPGCSWRRRAKRRQSATSVPLQTVPVGGAAWRVPALCWPRLGGGARTIRELKLAALR